jgi:tetratricopeptide (TPR) repeat protein
MVVGLAGCHNKAYSQSIEKGLNAVAENKYQKALTYFDNALTQKPKDEKAQAYRDQTQAYLTTTSELKAGKVKTALTTVDKGVKITNGATSLTNKLKQLKVTVTSDYQEYQQLSDDVKAQLKVKNGNYSADVLKRCAAINWDKKPYLKPLKAKVKQLLTAAKKGQDEYES